MPDPDAQRSLAGLVLDPSRTLRSEGKLPPSSSAASSGSDALITADQEARLAASIREETDPDVRADLVTILDALRPKPPDGSLDLQATQPHVPSQRLTPIQTPDSTTRNPASQSHDLDYVQP